MTADRPGATPEDQALAECAALVDAGPAKAILKGKLLEVSFDDNPRVLGSLVRAYNKLGLAAESARVSKRVDALRKATPRAGAPNRSDASAPKPRSLPPPPIPPPMLPKTSGGPSRTPPPPSVRVSTPPPAPVRSASAPPTPMRSASTPPAPVRSSTPPPAPVRSGSTPPPPAALAPTAPISEIELDPDVEDPPIPVAAPAPSSPPNGTAGAATPGASPRAEWAAIAGAKRRWAVPGVRRWHLIVAGVALFAGFCGYSAFVDHRLRSRLGTAERSISTGTPEGLESGAALLKWDFGLSWPVRFMADLLAGLPAGRLPTGVEASLLGLERAATFRLMGQPLETDLADLADRAEKLGAPPARVAFARIESALDHDDLQKALSIVRTWEDKTGDDPYFQLAAGATHARASDVEKTLARYDAARRLQPTALTPLLLAAELSASEDREHCDERIEALDKYDAHVARLSARALRGLKWFLTPSDQGPRLLPEALRLSTEQRRELPARLFGVPSMVRVKEAVIAKAPLDDCYAPALAGAEHATTVLTLGRFALLGGKHDDALAALQRLRAVAPGHPQIQRFGLDVALASADLAGARSIVAADTRSATILDAVMAYETLDLAALDKARPDLKDIPRAEALSVAREVLNGDKLLSERDVPEFADSVWGLAIQIDSALDRGQLGRVDRLLKQWNDPGSSGYLARLAELARYQGNPERALDLARRAAPETNRRAFLEELQALVAGGKATDALALVKSAQRLAILGPLGKWAKTFVVGKARGARAGAALSGTLPMPDAHAPLLERLMAARAMNTAGDLRGKSMVVLLEAVVPRHPMLELARRDR